MQFHHHGYVSHDPRVLPAAGIGLDRPAELPDEMDVLIVGTGPAGMVAAAQLSMFPDVHTRIIERRAGRLEIGQADGLQARSIETFQAFGFADRLLSEAYQITEMWFWRPDPEDHTRIRRAEKAIDSAALPGKDFSEFPHVICNQARVQDYFAEYARNSPSRLEPDYGWELLGLEVEDSGSHPVVVRLRRSAGETEGTERTVRARYVVGCDGARSGVRRAIGGKLQGDSRNHAWGVMDILVDTDFPDIRTKCAIQSSTGSILLIPREGNALVRVYVDLGDLAPDDAGKVRDTPIERIIEIAQSIFRPYRFEVRHVAWWSVYEVGQRVTDTFDDVKPEERGQKEPHVFIAGDACHTHSAKAGQGMNVSMQDTFNLAWKLGSVVSGRSPEALLDTYSEERQVVAQKLIDFDREWSTLMGAKVLDPEHPELGGVDPSEVTAHYVKSEVQASGFGTHYEPSIIVSDGEHQQLATGFPIGMRFHSAPVVRVCDATPQQLGHHMRADGRWRLYAFAGPDAPSASGAIDRWAEWVRTDPSSPYVTSRIPGTDAGSVFDVKAIYQQHHDEVEPGDVDPIFRPRFGPFQVIDEELVYAADEADDIFERRGVSREGCVVVVRPDMFVGTVLPLDRPELLAEYFAPILTEADHAAAATAPVPVAETVHVERSKVSAELEQPGE